MPVVMEPVRQREALDEGDAPGILVPFVRASHEHTEPAVDVSQLMGANSVALGPFEVPAYGFMRGIHLLVEGTGGAIGAGVLSSDAPWSAIEAVEMTDVNGRPLFQVTSGFRAFLSNKWGAYHWESDPSLYPGFSNTVNPVFSLYIPTEITEWDGFGSLANLNAAQSFKIRIVVNPATSANPGTGLFTTAPTTPPTLRIRAFLDAWQQPVGRDAATGNPTEQVPPGHGSTQFWSEQAFPIAATGEQSFKLARTGNFIRMLIFEFRDATGLRVDAGIPDPLRLYLDAEEFYNEARRIRQGYMRKRYGFGPDTGVVVYEFISDQDGHAGSENRHRWLHTVQATRLELRGNVGSTGTVRVLTNDVALSPEGALVR